MTARWTSVDGPPSMMVPTCAISFMEEAGSTIRPCPSCPIRVARRQPVTGGFTQDVFRSGEDLVRKTPDFYRNAARRLELQLAHAYVYAEDHFGGQNLYLEEMLKNVRHAQALADAPDAVILRRTPPAMQDPELKR